MRIDLLTSTMKANMDLNQPVEELKVNSEFSAQVLNVDDNKAVLRLANGKLLEAVIDKNMNLNLGDYLDLKVKSSQDGKIELKLIDVKSDMTKLTDSRVENLKTALLDMQEIPNTKNMEIAQELVKNNLPVNKENMKMVSNVANMFGESKIKDAVFLVSNGLDINEDNLNIMTQISDNKIELAKNLENLKSTITDILKNNPELSDKIEQIVAENFADLDAGVENNADKGQNAVKTGSPIKLDNAIDEHTGLQENIKVQTNTNGDNVNKQVEIKNQPADNNKIDSLEKELIKDLSSQEMQNNKIDANQKQNIESLINDIKDNKDNNVSKLIDLAKNIIEKKTITTNVDRQNIDENKAISEEKNVIISEDNVNNINKHNNISEDKTEKSVIDKVLNKAIFDVENLKGTNIKHFNEEMKNIEKTLSEINKAVTTSGNVPQEVKSALNNIVSNVSNTVQFMDKVNQNYIQMFIPLNNNGQITTGQLYIMKNNKNNKSQKDSSNLNIYFVLDTSNIGLVKINMNCAGKKLNIDFKVDNKIAVENIKAKSSELIESLKNFNYNVENLKVDVEKDKAALSKPDVINNDTKKLQNHFDFKV